MSAAAAKQFLLAFVAFWLVFGLITLFAPGLMDMFQTPEGVAAKTAYSNHIWAHDGLDILSVCVLVFAMSRLQPTPALMRAVGWAALMPTIGIAMSLATTTYWSPLFIIPGLGCLAFSLGAFAIAGRLSSAR